MKVLEYLKNLGIIEEEHSKFVIKFEDGREYDVVEILEEFNNSIEYKGIVYKVGDKVLVKGTKRIGLYETEIVKDLFGGFKLKENYTYLTDDRALMAIKEKL